MNDEILACTKCGRLIYLHAIGSPYSNLWAVEWRGHLWCQECAGKTLTEAQQQARESYKDCNQEKEK